MKIEDKNLAPLAGAQTTQINRANEAARAAQSRQVAGSAAVGDDQVDISGLGAAIAAEQSDSPVRTAKISRLAEAYQSGQYQVDPGAVARDIVSESLNAGTGSKT